jgi:hypothetical protein
MSLVFDVGRNDLIGDISAAATEVAARPDVPAPELFAQVGKLAEQLVRGLPLEALHQAAEGDLRGDRDEEVDGVLGDMAFEEADIVVPTDLPQQVSDPQCHFAAQHLARRYLVTHTRWRWTSKTEWAPRR